MSKGDGKVSFIFYFSFLLILLLLFTKRKLLLLSYISISSFSSSINHSRFIKYLGHLGRIKKEAYFKKLEQLLNEYPTIFIVNVDNVGSNQMHQIRKNLRGDAQILMGKNTMVRKALRNLIPENPEYEKLLSAIRGNVGFVFTKGDLKSVRQRIVSNRVCIKQLASFFSIYVIDNW